MRAEQAIAVAHERLLPGSLAVSEGNIFSEQASGDGPEPEVWTAERCMSRLRSTENALLPVFGDPTEDVRILPSRWPGSERRVFTRADRVRSGRFDLLGYEDLCFGDPIDWHLDPVAGVRAPREHWSLIGYLDPQIVGDHKVIWELNRHQYFVDLGKAYRYSGDERYAASLVDHLVSWMDANPPKVGINWASSLELAYRSISWIWGLQLIARSPHLEPDVLLRALRYLDVFGRHIETYLSTYFSPNTHLTGEALGLVYLGCAFPRWKLAERWRAKGLEILEAEIEKQVFEDGVYFERSSYYQKYTADIYLHLLALDRSRDLGVSDRTRSRVRSLLHCLMTLARPDGTLPLFGDDDGGGLLNLTGTSPGDVRPLLGTGAVLFDDPELRHGAREASEEIVWLLGREGLDRFDQLDPHPPSRTARGFREGGFYVMRSDWEPDASHLAISCGPHGGGGHAHADALSFELTVEGESLIVDPGTGSYTADPELRDALRSSLAHNTVSLDGRSSSGPGDPFGWRTSARGMLRRWIAGDDFVYFEGEHDGYERLTPPATHVRSILWPAGDYWVLRDRVVTGGSHLLSSRLQFAPGTRVATTGPHSARAVRDAGEEAALAIEVLGADALTLEDARVSPLYGRVRTAPALRCEARVAEDTEILTVLLPRREGAAADPSTTIARQTDGALHIVRGDHEDRLEFAGSSGSGEVAWVRTSRATGEPRACLLISGRRLRRDGRNLVRSDAYIGFLSAVLDGGVLRIETDAEEPMTLSFPGAHAARVNGASVPVSSGGEIRLPAGAGRDGASPGAEPERAGSAPTTSVGSG